MPPSQKDISTLLTISWPIDSFKFWTPMVLRDSWKCTSITKNYKFQVRPNGLIRSLDSILATSNENSLWSRRTSKRPSSPVCFSMCMYSMRAVRWNWKKLIPSRWAIHVCLLFYWLYMRSKYQWTHILGVLVLVDVLGLFVASDAITNKDYPREYHN